MFRRDVCWGWVGLILGGVVNGSLAEEPAPSIARFRATASASAEAGGSEAEKSHETVLKDVAPIEGVIRTYRVDEKLIAELTSADYDSEFILLISIARGIGLEPILGGMTWDIGNDWVVRFRKIGKQVHLVRRNVRFRASKNTPEATAVENAYTDSVLFSLPVLTRGPNGGDLIDLTPVFMSDLPQISQVLSGFSFSAEKSIWEAVKGFDRNLEIEVAATYASSGRREIESVADTRGVTVAIHYSLSKIPESDFQPRLADDRIGYFLTVVKDYSSSSQDSFVRYINRWNLRRADSESRLSVPKKPIVFWIENTVPFKYRKPIHDGIAEWNVAFEQAGFLNAIEVRQQPDNASWDPEDINYNTFRWITSDAGFAIGPSRVNPYTGQILDADILFDAGFLESWNTRFETFGPDDAAAMTGGPLDLDAFQALTKSSGRRLPFSQRACVLSRGMRSQLSFGHTMLKTNEKGPDVEELKERLIVQGLKLITMHEVGHTLGLRHNFKASTHLTLEQMNQPDITRQTGLAASVMDYLPANVLSDPKQQHDFYSTTVGVYDRWAIEYGYKQFSGGTQGELPKLQEIAARSAQPGHVFATDEDTRSIDPDPFSNRFDLGKDPLVFAQRQADLVRERIPKLTERLIDEGEDYSQARQAFNVLLAEHGRCMFFVARLIGGFDVNRSHKGDDGAAPPLTPIDPQKQRDAIALLAEQVLSDRPYQVDPKLYSFLAPNNWSHWGQSKTLRTDFPVHEVIATWQLRILSQLLSPLTLERLHDIELKVDADADAFTVAELIQSLTDTVFAELEQLPADANFTERKPAISSLRRNLQRNYLKLIANLSLGRTSAPEDCQTIAYAQLSALADKMQQSAAHDGLDRYSKAHLLASAERIRKVLDASLNLYSP